jgi:hypothetical protein
VVEQALKHAENDELHRGHFADEGAECDDGAEAKARVTRIKTNKQIRLSHLSMLLFMISTGSSRSGSTVVVQVHAFELSWFTKCGRVDESL